jgi:hypothetical protein
VNEGAGATEAAEAETDAAKPARSLAALREHGLRTAGLGVAARRALVRRFGARAAAAAADPASGLSDAGEDEGPAAGLARDCGGSALPQLVRSAVGAEAGVEGAWPRG